MTVIPLSTSERKDQINLEPFFPSRHDYEHVSPRFLFLKADLYSNPWLEWSILYL